MLARMDFDDVNLGWQWILPPKKGKLPDDFRANDSYRDVGFTSATDFAVTVEQLGESHLASSSFE
jgi:hypothetical protein